MRREEIILDIGFAANIQIVVSSLLIHLSDASDVKGEIGAGKSFSWIRGFLTRQVIGGRHLMKPARGIWSPFVEIELVGADHDNAKVKTAAICKSR